jgi:hypothetical protein
MLQRRTLNAPLRLLVAIQLLKGSYLGILSDSLCSEKEAVVPSPSCRRTQKKNGVTVIRNSQSTEMNCHLKDGIFD